MAKSKFKNGNYVMHTKSGYIGKIKYFVGIFDGAEYWNVDWINLPFYNKKEAVNTDNMIKINLLKTLKTI